MPTIRTFLDLSTAHLPQAICDHLGAQPGVLAYATAHGWLMWVPEHPDEPTQVADDPIPDVVLGIWRYGQQLGCDYVLFDADADQVDGLPSWDW